MSKGLMSLLLSAGLVVSAFAGTEAGAERIVMEHRLAMLEWEKKVEMAPTLEARAELLKTAPDGAAFGKRMIEEVGKDFREDWSVKYGAWLLRVHPGLKLADVKFLVEYMERFQMKSADLGEFSVALASGGGGDQASAAALLALKVKFLEKVLAGEAAKEVKGEAALGLSMVLGQMGEGAGVNERRLRLLRQAIIDSSPEAKVGDVAVKDLVKEELYVLTKLSKGVVGPELVGVDARGVPMKLSEYRGKAVMLVFWSSWESGAEVLEYLKGVETKYAGKPVAVVGVNRDAAGNLRGLAELGKLAGRTFSDADETLFRVYRVEAGPYVFVLNKKGVIEYSGQLGAFADLTVDAILAEPAR